ncbi:2-deoxy-scyllo-inosose synthase [Paenibacillus sp. KS-LC4]|uniref:2-deoxy-scyllo-inosose synthase n=1 Tax=Paenibacillus sp. KS-LC4 TaxID=2979727 RepID=UPI0030CC60F6
MINKKIRFGERQFDYIFGENILLSLSQYIDKSEYGNFFIIADKGVPNDIIARAVDAFGVIAPTHTIRVADGEQHKSLDAVNQAAEEIIGLGADRRSAIVAVGGGLTGNIAGVLAGLLFRGIALIHYPTTFLAASDSVLSIKQAVNLKGGKNLVGFYYTPRLVLADTAVLSRAPQRHIRAGMCELIKNLLVGGMNEIVQLLRPDNKYTPEEIERFIEYCIEAKMTLLCEDVFEKKRGLIFEYGHTIGHALELAEKGRLLHGEAIAAGMIYAAKIANRMELLSQRDVELHYELLQKIGVLQDIEPAVNADAILHYQLNDNKRGYLSMGRDQLGMVLLKGAGVPWMKNDSLITAVNQSLIYEVLCEGIGYELVERR